MPAESLQFIRLPKVKDRVARSRSSIYLRIANGEFPAPYNLGGRAVAWLETEVEDWIQRRLATRDNGSRP